MKIQKDGVPRLGLNLFILLLYVFVTETQFTLATITLVTLSIGKPRAL